MPMHSLVLDLVALAVISLCAAYYARRGFIAGVFSFFGTLIALAVAGIAAYYLSPGVFDSFFRPGLEEAVTASISQHGFTSLSDLLGKMMSFAPQHLIDAVLASVDPSIDMTAGDLSRQIVSEVLAPIITPFITAIIFFVLFSLVRMLIGVVRSLAVSIAKIPAMNTVNGALGAVIGVLIALLYVYLGFCVIWAYDSMNPANAVGSLYFGKSLLFRLLSPLNLFA